MHARRSQSFRDAEDDRDDDLQARVDRDGPPAAVSYRTAKAFLDRRVRGSLWQEPGRLRVRPSDLARTWRGSRQSQEPVARATRSDLQSKARGFARQRSCREPAQT